MRYTQYRSSRRVRPTKRRGAKRFFSLAFLVVLSAGGWLFWQGQDQPPAASNTSAPAVPVVTDQIEEVADTVVALAVPGDVNAAEVGQTIDLTFLESGSGFGATAHRESTEQNFNITVVATLPFIDDATQAYEVWLVKPGVTDFFSVGNMFRREDGGWGLVWETDPLAFEKDVSEYTRVVITRELRDGLDSPSTAHVMQGTF